MSISMSMVSQSEGHSIRNNSSKNIGMYTYYDNDNQHHPTINNDNDDSRQHLPPLTYSTASSSSSCSSSSVSTTKSKHIDMQTLQMNNGSHSSPTFSNSNSSNFRRVQLTPFQSSSINSITETSTKQESNSDSRHTKKGKRFSERTLDLLSNWYTKYASCCPNETTILSCNDYYYWSYSNRNDDNKISGNDGESGGDLNNVKEVNRTKNHHELMIHVPNSILKSTTFCNHQGHSCDTYHNDDDNDEYCNYLHDNNDKHPYYSNDQKVVLYPKQELNQEYQIRKKQMSNHDKNETTTPSSSSNIIRHYLHPKPNYFSNINHNNDDDKNKNKNSNGNGTGSCSTLDPLLLTPSSFLSDNTDGDSLMGEKIMFPISCHCFTRTSNTYNNSNNNHLQKTTNSNAGTSTFITNNHHNHYDSQDDHDFDTKIQRHFPLHDFDLDYIHPISPPYMGTSYWQEDNNHETTTNRNKNKNHTQQQPPSLPPEGEEENKTNILLTDIQHNFHDSSDLISYIEELSTFDNLDISNIAHPLSPSTPPSHHQKRHYYYYHSNKHNNLNHTNCSPRYHSKHFHHHHSPLCATHWYEISPKDDVSSFSMSYSPSYSNRSSQYHTYNNTTPNSKERKVLVTFTPRRLFGHDEEEGEEVKNNDNHDQKVNAKDGTRSNEINHCHSGLSNSKNANTNNSKSGMIDSITIEQQLDDSIELIQCESNQYPSCHEDHDQYDIDINDESSHSSENSNILNPTTLFTSTPSATSTAANNIKKHIITPSPSSLTNNSSVILKNGILTKSTIKQQKLSPPSSPCPSVSTHKSLFSIQTRDVPDGGRKKDKHSGIIKKHINTLPSFQSGVPIRLKVTESYAGFSSLFVNPYLEPQEQQQQQQQPKQEDHHKRNSDKDRSDGPDVSFSSSTSSNLNTSNVSMLSDLEQTNFFSYDPYFSLGEYLISTSQNLEYGNGLSVKMGEQYMTLQDKDGKVYGVTRSRHTFIPSSVIYSSKAKFTGQTPSSHRPNLNNHHCHHDDDNTADIELYPWAMAKKVGRRMDHEVGIHLVVNPEERRKQRGGDVVGGLFRKDPSFVSRHGFDSTGGHSHTVVYRIVDDEKDGSDHNDNDDNITAINNNSDFSMKGADSESGVSGDNVCSSDGKVVRQELLCCIMLRDPVYRDVFDVTIAPGIDPLLIVCSMAAHFKMDVEPKLSDQ